MGAGIDERRKMIHYSAVASFVQMKRRFIFYLFLCCLGLLPGCSNRSFQTRDSQTVVGDALMHSRLWAYVRSLSSRSYFMIVNETPDYFEAEVGASTPERFELLGSVRVLRQDGKVLKEDYDKNGEEIWVDDMLESAIRF
jgi:hypothetical protein